MALPKEPRQKMINIMYLVLTALLAINVSAEILNAFKTITASLEKTNSTVTASTQQVFASLTEKMSEAGTREKASAWQPKAKQVVDYSATAYNYITILKNKLITEAGGDPTNPDNPDKKMNDEDQNMVTRVMVKEGEGKKLYAILQDYMKNVLTDPDLKKEFEKSLPISLEMPKKMIDNKKHWEEANFFMAPTVGALSILTKFQNDIKNTENKMVTFCHEQVGKVELRFDAFEAIVGQNSNYLMPGQQIEITAGLGAFSKTKLPQISINGASQQLNEKGQAIYKGDAGGIGQHTINVNVAFTDQDGKAQTRVIPVTYTVGQANASIALDKMNVLYIGVDNPVSIAASGGGDDKVKVAIAGGAGTIIKKSAGKYVVKVAQQSDDCKITVSVDGKVAGVSQFRVRQIPKPVATIGGLESGANIPAASFKAQGGVAAWLKDFPFDLKFTVTQFSFSTDSDDGDLVSSDCKGNAFSPDASGKIRQHIKPGKTVYIDNIKAIGEDGRNVPLPSLTYYIK